MDPIVDNAIHLIDSFTPGNEIITFSDTLSK